MAFHRTAHVFIFVFICFLASLGSISVEVVYPYDAVLKDEMTIKPGDVIFVEEQSGNWWRGRNRRPRTKQTGLFYKDFVKAYNTDSNEGTPLESQQKPEGYCVGYRKTSYYVMEKPGDDLECIICHQLVYEPRQTSCCGHTVCCGCADKWREKNNSCPQCRRSPLRQTDDPRTIRYISGLTAYCPNYEKGCEWTGSLNKVDNHLSEMCQFTVITCDQCLESLQRKYLNEHKKEKCLKRSIVCPCCGYPKQQTRKGTSPWYVSTLAKAFGYSTAEFTYQHLIQYHYRDCPKWPLRCPNHCGTDDMLTRSTLKDHLENHCLEQVTSCQFAEVGCTVRVKRKEMADHIQQSMGEHVTSMMSDYIKVKKELDEVKKENRQLKAEVKKENQQLKVVYEVLRDKGWIPK